MRYPGHIGDVLVMADPFIFVNFLQHIQRRLHDGISDDNDRTIEFLITTIARWNF
jgi:hypothetical protein